MGKIQLDAGHIAVAARQRKVGCHPSIFIQDFYVNDKERFFELWLYKKRFRPAFENYLGATVTHNGIDTDIANQFYKVLLNTSNSQGSGFNLTNEWNSILYFATKINQIKQLVT
jgi:hypothetical protein